jgi:hypothetical protein
MSMYKYLRVYAINGIIVNLFYSTQFLEISYRIVPFANTFSAQVYLSYIKIPIISTGYFYSKILHIIITLDRLGFFSNWIKSLMILSPYKTCTIGFISGFLINFSFFLVFTPVALLNPKTGEQ